MQRHWMPFHIGDYLGDTEHLSTLQHGAYCLLLFSYWRRGGLPDDDQQLANITKLPLDQWLIQRPILRAFFYDDWKHKRVEAELRRHAEKMGRLRIAGEKGRMVAEMNREKARWRNQTLR
jgi:uncharacterized protein YdaU (DUF1376 family)